MQTSGSIAQRSLNALSFQTHPTPISTKEVPKDAVWKVEEQSWSGL